MRPTEKLRDPQNPYLNARREWNERYGDYIDQANRWRRIAYVNGAIALVAVIGIAWIGAQSKLVPYLVEVTHEGQAVAGHVATPTAIDDNIIHHLLAGWFQDWRGVSVDAGIEAKMIDRVYSFLSPSDPAYNTVNAYFQANQPYERAKREVVAINIQSILRITKESLQVEWDEETRDRRGNVTKREKFKASVVITLIPPTTEETIMKNPVGLYVKDVQISQQLY